MTALFSCLSAKLAKDISTGIEEIMPIALGILFIMPFS